MAYHCGSNTATGAPPYNRLYTGISAHSPAQFPHAYQMLPQAAIPPDYRGRCERLHYRSITCNRYRPPTGWRNAEQQHRSRHFMPVCKQWKRCCQCNGMARPGRTSLKQWRDRVPGCRANPLYDVNTRRRVTTATWSSGCLGCQLATSLIFLCERQVPDFAELA